VENATPTRVQTTVSPPRVANTTPQQMSPQPTTSAHSTPNSHRRQKTPARRAVTPQTPHIMVRRSAGQQHNLSQDMIAETISQANHCFSISTTPYFGVKYVGREHAEHLMACIKKNYNSSSDWNGSAYCGLTLDWDYKNRTVDLSMPGYIKAALHKYQYAAPVRPEHAPHTWNPPIYGAKMQFVKDETISPGLSDKHVNKLQQLTGTLLYYSRAVDPTLIMPINVLASEQSKATEVTADKVIKLLN
jgi:hypothetical protein